MELLVSIPERVTDNEKCDIYFVCILQNIVAGRFDHFAVRNNHGAAIESFLLCPK